MDREAALLSQHTHTPYYVRMLMSIHTIVQPGEGPCIIENQTYTYLPQFKTSIRIVRNLNATNSVVGGAKETKGYKRSRPGRAEAHFPSPKTSSNISTARQLYLCARPEEDLEQGENVALCHTVLFLKP